MKTGDTVQVAHLDGRIHWIYGVVITANDDGSAVVQIAHAGNIEHGAIKLFPKGKIRTKADLQAELDAMRPVAGEYADAFRQRQASVYAQIDRLS